MTPADVQAWPPAACRRPAPGPSCQDARRCWPTPRSRRVLAGPDRKANGRPAGGGTTRLSSPHGRYLVCSEYGPWSRASCRGTCARRQAACHRASRPCQPGPVPGTPDPPFCMAASSAAWGVRAAPEWALCGPKGEVDPRCEWRQVGAAADLIVQGKPLATPGLVKRIMPTQRESGTGRPLGALAAQRLWAGHVLQPDGLAHDAGFAENLIHAGQSLTREMLTLVALAAGGQHGKVAGRAAATGLPEPDEHYGHAAPAPQGRSRQRP